MVMVLLGSRVGILLTGFKKSWINALLQQTSLRCSPPISSLTCSLLCPIIPPFYCSFRLLLEGIIPPFYCSFHRFRFENLWLREEEFVSSFEMWWGSSTDLSLVSWLSHCVGFVAN